MQQLVSNDRYAIAVDTAKNRLYLTVKGYWLSPQDAPRYVEDLTTAAKRLRPQFAVLTDATTMRPHHEDVMPLHIAAQQALMAAGMSRVAEILPRAATRLQTRRLSNQSGMFKAEFDTHEEAEAWLDAQTAR
ncbi:hypothetical protein SAMN05444365_106150 [Micromonospora pattaloongensis]|uniref:SpoIIAA-like n=1 Tax=Micromonospora pattaloongensis TaxID=405436 RepID=A0A1H3QXA2_9ACTN|nr:hypothetical protein [Micromonospora pattaloongensis]SDZ17339.1 hypothetical protein SAMN05444365_106150 [Micromonospora pattaloongensis]